MQDTTLELKDAPPSYASELRIRGTAGIGVAGFLVLAGAVGFWLVSLRGFWQWLGWPVVLVSAMLVVQMVRDLALVLSDRGSPTVRKIESEVHLALVHLGREIHPFTNTRDQHLATSGRAKSRLILEDGSQWHLSKRQLDQVRFAKRARLWVGPRSGAIILVEKLEPAKS